MNINFTKGEATLNDFVVVDGRNGLDLHADQVRALCDRRAGIGADGVLRVVRAGQVPDWQGEPDLWFMDYRNADGSLAQMCGNGTRVFATWLADRGLVEPEERFAIGTRAGVRTIDWNDGQVRTGMGQVVLADRPVSVRLPDGAVFEAQPVDVGNPHAVVQLTDDSRLTGLDLAHGIEWEPISVFPEGVNVEFFVVTGPARLRMRVLERGVGETYSCGTGVVATAMTWASGQPVAPDQVEVEVPGGRLQVRLDGSQAWLQGPARLVAEGRIELDDAGAATPGVNR